MIIVDSCGWLEWFTDSPLADSYRQYLADPDRIVLPAIVLYEVYKVLKREAGEENALLAVSYMKNAAIVPLDDTLALAAADIALNEKLAMADAIIVAVSKAHGCRIVTSDADLQGQRNVMFIPKQG